MGAFGGRFDRRSVMVGTVLLAAAGAWAVAARAQERSTAESAPTQGQPESDEPGSVSQPDPEEIISRLQADRAANVPIPPVREEGEGDREDEQLFQPVSPNANLEPLMPEGAYLVDRTGRLVKRGSWWTFVHEDRGRVVRARELRVLPNQLLETMEYASSEGTGDIVFVVSGEVTEFHGANYLLLRKVLIQRDLGNLGGTGGS